MIVLDGQLAEPEWVEARVLDDFRVTEPLTRERPSHATVARVLTRPEALYIALRVTHPENLRVRGRSPRDARFMEADPVTVMVDFEGQGTTAYEFTVSLSGSIRDGTVLPPNVISYDWDGVWYSAVAEDETGWTVEIELPWSVAPMRESGDGMRQIGVFVSREVQATGERYSFPAIEMRSPTFVADFFTYAQRQWQLDLDVNWYPTAKSEFRAKLQFVALQARARQAYDIAPDGDLVDAAVQAPDFSLGDLGLQLRLRYEFKPLSDLFVVYSYGGSTFIDQEAEWDHLLRESIDTPAAHQLLLKLSYRF